MSLAPLLRRAWMDLVSAGAFLAIWILRDRFEPETLATLLLWPVVFELMLVFGLALAGMGDGIRNGPLRGAWFGAVATIYLGLALWGGEAEGLPWLSLAAFWLLIARLAPPAGQRWLGPQHRRWLFKEGLPYSTMVWVLAFFAYLLLLVLIPGDCLVDPGGERHCRSPAWPFALVWTTYFVAEALVRAWRMSSISTSAS